ncbi:hypothetical protein LTR10_010745 [Elasticomyces elasticus]|nr:hypothetical protein LTR10_010745 [Elasticomyces elasticus]KAK4968351.1 hypothetical protein LTR42_009634 [Elasticomyces elasticus]
MPEPMDALKQGLAELYKSGNFTDFEIDRGRQIFKVHKAVICAQSRYFWAPCGKNYAEGSEGRIVLKAASDDDKDDGACDDPQAIKLMVEFFYHLDYNVDIAKPALEETVPPISASKTRALSLVEKMEQFRLSARTESSSPSSETVAQRRLPLHKRNLYDCLGPQPIPLRAKENAEDAVMHAKVFAAAVKYQVAALQDLAATKFSIAASHGWEHPTFADAVLVAYTTTPDSMRQIRDVVATIILRHNSLLDKGCIEDVVKMIPNLNFELLRLALGMKAVGDGRNQG